MSSPELHLATTEYRRHDHKHLFIPLNVWLQWDVVSIQFHSLNLPKTGSASTRLCPGHLKDPMKLHRRAVSEHALCLCAYAISAGRPFLMPLCVLIISDMWVGMLCLTQFAGILDKNKSYLLVGIGMPNTLRS